ncbi:glycosyltransferase [Flavobacterium cellulosilyticum]|uniref:Glycosyltransferase n=2 Tax=Flavobacterium cellulosilyticum TaxID=2541731 RepID=A0A4R5CD90_9FLAO|nr:glycosyltransferase [Flavobacterium cellulosilyticum]
MDYSVYSGDLFNLNFSKKKLITTINQYSYCIGEKDPEFKNALLQSDVLLPDGMAIVSAIQHQKGKKIKKISGADIHLHLLNHLNEKYGSCFYMGSSESTLLKIKERLATEFPNISVGTYSPPFKTFFTNNENKIIVDAINDFSPDVVFVGMTAPKQEKWAFEHKTQLNAKTICAIGAVFDFYARTVKRPSSFWINLKLEWFIRLVKEPKRMWKRYLYYGPVFIGYILQNKKKSYFEIDQMGARK